MAHPVLQRDVTQILSANRVPMSFSIWLTSQGVLCIKNVANAAVSSIRFEHEAIDGCSMSLGLGLKAFVRSACAAAKSAQAIDPTSASNAASVPVAEDDPQGGPSPLCDPFSVGRTAKASLPLFRASSAGALASSSFRLPSWGIPSCVLEARAFVPWVSP